MSLTIGVDVGGTKVAAGVVDEDGLIIEADRRDTPATDVEATERVILDLVALFTAKYDVEAIGVGAPGFVDARRSTVLFTPNMAWREEPLRVALEKQCGLPVVVENDANAAAWGEAHFGSGRGEDHVVAITVGTGIGGGVVVDGKLYRGAFGIAAEIGHLNVIPDGRPCGCGLRGCWEQYASGRALVREARELAATRPGVAARLLELGDGSPDGISGPEVTKAAREGDPAALDVLGTIATWLAHGMADLAAILDPAMFVIGGGVSEAGDLLLPTVQQEFSQRLTGNAHRPLAAVAIAKMGPEAGLVGAADLARYR